MMGGVLKFKFLSEGFLLLCSLVICVCKVGFTEARDLDESNCMFFLVCLGQISLSGGEAYSQHHGGENEAGSKVHPNEGTEQNGAGLGLW